MNPHSRRVLGWGTSTNLATALPDRSLKSVLQVFNISLGSASDHSDRDCPTYVSSEGIKSVPKHALSSGRKKNDEKIQGLSDSQ